MHFSASSQHCWALRQHFSAQKNSRQRPLLDLCFTFSLPLTVSLVLSHDVAQTSLSSVSGEAEDYGLQPAAWHSRRGSSRTGGGGGRGGFQRGRTGLRERPDTRRYSGLLRHVSWGNRWLHVLLQTSGARRVRPLRGRVRSRELHRWVLVSGHKMRFLWFGKGERFFVIIRRWI